MTANPKPVELVALLRPPQPANDLLELFASTELDPSVPDHVWEAALVGPATAFLARPGKQLRAKLVATGWRLGGGSGEPPPAIARALEILHAGSLIVDDVEDRSDERRGGPALHVLIGEPLAINTGSWMYFWALEQLCALPGAVELAVRALARCHQGQALDLAARIGELAMSEVPAVVAATTRHKTGALARLATELGALAAGAGVDHRARIGELGEATGIALQMLDDLGAIAAPERRAKAYEDLRAQRPTWPWAWLAHQADAPAPARRPRCRGGRAARTDRRPRPRRGARRDRDGARARALRAREPRRRDHLRPSRDGDHVWLSYAPR
jgi:geranylgeranyl pyrophosphate synthase